MIKREQNSSPNENPANVVFLDTGSLRHSWRWCRELGATLIMLGVLAFGILGFAASSVVMLLGWLILVSGLAETVHALYLHRSGAFFFHLVPGVAGIPIGLLILTHPAAGDVGWTLLFACLFTVVGLFRLLAALRLKFRSWPWAVVDGAVMLLLGAVFWTTRPWLDSWFVCLAVGVSLILRGWSLIMFGRALRDWRRPSRSRPQGHASVPNHATMNPYGVTASDWPEIFSPRISKSILRRQTMSAQKSNQLATSQITSRGESKGQQTGLARRAALPTLPSLLLDPLGFFEDDPFSLVRRMQKEMNRVFSQAGLDFSSRGDEFLSTAWVPAAEIAYRDGNLIVSAELPGLTERDVKVEVNDDFLTIQGERKVEQEETEGGIRRTERRYGQFYRAIALPEGADTEHARAEFQNGVLHVTIPVPQAQSNLRQIPIQTPTAAQGTEQKPATSEAPAGQKVA